MVVTGKVGVDNGGDVAVEQPHLAPERRGKGGVGGITASGDADQRGAGSETRGVEDLPPRPPPRLDDGVEVHRRQTRGVDGHQPGRHAERPAQRDGQMGEVAARTDASEEGVDRGVLRVARTGLVRQSLEDPGRDRMGEGRSALRAAELHRRETRHDIRRAIPALAQGGDRFSVDDDLIGGGRRHRHLLRPDRSLVTDGQPAGVGVDDVYPAAPIGGHLRDRRIALPAVETHIEPFFQDIPRRARRRHLQRQDRGGRHVELQLTSHAPDGAAGGGGRHGGSIAVATRPGKPETGSSRAQTACVLSTPAHQLEVLADHVGLVGQALVEQRVDRRPERAGVGERRLHRPGQHLAGPVVVGGDVGGVQRGADVGPELLQRLADRFGAREI